MNTLPRSAPKEIIEHRITFGKWERDRVDTLITSLSINQVSEPIVEIIKDVSAMSILVSLYLGFRYGQDAVDMMADSYDDVSQLFNDTRAINKSFFVAGQVPIPGVGNLNNIFSLLDAILPGDANPFDAQESRREGGKSGRQ